ncbi:hypothetical protein D9M71_833050 [compost metagenome]
MRLRPAVLPASTALINAYLTRRRYRLSGSLRKRVMSRCQASRSSTAGWQVSASICCSGHCSQFSTFSHQAWLESLSLASSTPPSQKGSFRRIMPALPPGS